VLDASAITIISGGQTGADRAALDVAIDHGIAHGGWCPRGRLAEDGRIDARYSLRETPARKYAQRTEWNVRDSDATVVFTMAPCATGGSSLTLGFARRLGKPALHLSRHSFLDSHGDTEAANRAAAETLLVFLAEFAVRVLNVAGPRASQEPEVGGFVRGVLQLALTPTR
jgi:hypothetical protein